MKPTLDIEAEVQGLLAQGRSKLEVLKALDGKAEREEVEFFLKQTPYPALKERFKLLNAALLLSLGYVTLKKFYFALSFGSFSVFTLIALVVPTINIYLFNEVRRFRRMGYELLAVLSILSLLNAENRAFPEVALMPMQAIMAGLLLYKLFIEPDKQRPWKDYS